MTDIIILMVGFVIGAWVRNYCQDAWDDERAQHIQNQDEKIRRLESKMKGLLEESYN